MSSITTYIINILPILFTKNNINNVSLLSETIAKIDPTHRLLQNLIHSIYIPINLHYICISNSFNLAI